MNIQQLNRSDAEIIYGNFTNVQGATITTGYAVCLTTAVASYTLGNQAVLPVAGSVRGFLGVSESDVADNDVGRYISYGYAASVYMFGHATSVSVVADTAAGPGASSLGVGYTGITTVLGPLVVLHSVGAVIRSAGGYVTGYVKAL